LWGRALDRLEELEITPRGAAVLGWAGSPPTDARRVPSPERHVLGHPELAHHSRQELLLYHQGEVVGGVGRRLLLDVGPSGQLLGHDVVEHPVGRLP
jgi:hypothetical protein